MKEIIDVSEKLYQTSKEGWYTHADELDAMKAISEGEILASERPGELISREAVIYYIKSHIHEIISESGTDKNAHTNEVLRAIINGVETMPGESIALERYEDLCEYFGDAKAVLNNREEFKKWLERVQDNVNKADALYDEMEKIEKVKEFLEILGHFNVKADYILKLMRGAEDD